MSWYLKLFEKYVIWISNSHQSMYR